MRRIRRRKHNFPISKDIQEWLAMRHCLVERRTSKRPDSGHLIRYSERRLLPGLVRMMEDGIEITDFGVSSIVVET
jgi:hypothetical protein